MTRNKDYVVFIDNKLIYEANPLINDGNWHTLAIIGGKKRSSKALKEFFRKSRLQISKSSFHN